MGSRAMWPNIMHCPHTGSSLPRCHPRCRDLVQAPPTAGPEQEKRSTDRITDHLRYHAGTTMSSTSTRPHSSRVRVNKWMRGACTCSLGYCHNRIIRAGSSFPRRPTTIAALEQPHHRYRQRCHTPIFIRARGRTWWLERPFIHTLCLRASSEREDNGARTC